MMLMERMTRLLFAVLFGPLVLGLAFETLLRRRRAAQRKGREASLAQAYQDFPQTRPTREFRVPKGSSPADGAVPPRAA